MGFGVWGSEFKAQAKAQLIHAWLRAALAVGLGFRVQGLGFRVQGLGFRV